MKNKLIVAGLSACLIVFGFAVVSSADLINNGSFEASNVTDHNGKWQQFASVQDWSNADRTEIQTYLLFGPAADGDQYVELDSRSGDGNDWLTQTFNTVADEKYEFSFAFSPRQNRAENILDFGIVSYEGFPHWLFFDTLSASGTGLRGTDWTYYSYSFVADTDFATIAFRDGGADDSYGTFIDDVSAAPAPVPEPATMLLFGTGLVGLAGSMIRKKK